MSHSSSSGARFSRIALLALLAALAVALAGCSWVGAGRDVGEALKKTAEVKTATYSATFNFEVSGLPAEAAADSSMKMTMQGAVDDSDPAAPRSLIELSAPGVMQLKVIEPGDGNNYLVTDFGTFGAPVDPQATAAAEQGMAGVLKALEPAIGGFREGAGDRTADGEALKTVYAEGDAGKICDDVLPSFMGAMESAATSNGDSLKALTGGGDLGSGCRKLLKSDPKLWFGIDSSGLLRMIALETEIAVAGTPVQMKVSMRFDINPTDRIPPIEKPSGAKMLASQAEIAAALTRSATR